MNRLNAICLFAGASPGNDPIYIESAQDTGRAMAARGVTMVFGGGRRGMMGTAADAAIAHGGRVIGVIPTFLQRREQSYAAAQLTTLHVVRSMHARKAMMAKLADGFLALPGGFGTLEELCEMTTWTQLGVHAKAVVLVNVRGYFDPLLAMFDRAVASGFLDPRHRALVLSAPTPSTALELFEHFTPPATDAHVDLEEA
jgi:uncharacterized protein (TIGR00730 family)